MIVIHSLPICSLELCDEGISTLKKNQLPQLHSSAFDMKLFTVAVKDIIKQPLTFTFGETEDGDDDCDGDSYVVDDDIHDGSTADVILKLSSYPGGTHYWQVAA